MNYISINNIYYKYINIHIHTYIHMERERACKTEYIQYYTWLILAQRRKFECDQIHLPQVGR